MKHFLVVDDSAVIRKVARRILDGLSFRTSEAEDGEQALALCRTDMPDAILLDGAMPVVDGFEFLKRLRLLPNGRDPKVVFCTADCDVGTIARAMHAGADTYMWKPFDKPMLQESLAEVGLA
ncbi:MAG TPA: response regulator [Beijerinckiaceae bacterium]|nr:response regulator [Beijerinckiaceae bacterium]